jgi:hypothetical protein
MEEGRIQGSGIEFKSDQTSQCKQVGAFANPAENLRKQAEARKNLLAVDTY